MKHAAHLLLTAIFWCSASSVAAAESAADYPSRPIRFITPFVAGGPGDVLSRLLGQKLTESWGQTVVVDNRGSAGGIVGFDLGAKAPADGYTLLLATGSGLTINPSVYLKLPYDPQRDFQPITQVTAAAYLLGVHPSVPAKSVPELIALAKTRPGQFNFATTGTNNLLAMELFNHMAGIKTVAIAYKGTGQAINSLIGGEVQLFIISPLIGLPQVSAGRLRALGLTGLKRSPFLPDLPTIAETLPGYEQIIWHSVVVPAKTPKAIVAKLARELNRIIKLPETQERFRSQGLDAVGSTPEELAALIKNEVVMYARLVKQIGLEPQ